eukprot:m.196713 g.196713  ORF g.196713 m.196713 type:complete len:352 (+) comp15257_c0_seq3:2490-3545(+)
MWTVNNTGVPTNLNVDFLRSGFEFKPDAPTLPAASPEFERKKNVSPESPRSRNRRLDDFYNKTLQSFQSQDLDAWDGMPCSPRRRLVVEEEATAPAGPAVVLNLDFLRSGAEFKPTPKTSRTNEVPSPRTTRNNRLEAFHQRSLEAVSSRKAEKSPIGINVDFLRSGAEFKPSPTMTRKGQTGETAAPSPRTTRHNRLEEFHQRSLRAATAHTATAPTSQDLVLNLDFLRSGAEFKPSPTMSRKGETAVPSPRSTRNARLEAFHKATLEAAKIRANQQMLADLDAWDGMPMAAPANTIVNLDYLRTNAFKDTHPTDAPNDATNGNQDARPARSRHQRLEDFYMSSIRVHNH